MRLLTLLLVLGATASSATASRPAAAAAAPDLTGHWNGSIALPGAPLAFDVDLRADGSGDISIPAQAAADLPLIGFSIAGTSVRFSISGVPGEPSFEGTVDGQRVTGKFTQAGTSFDFVMSAGESRAARARAALHGLDQQILSALADFGVPGLAIAVVHDGEVVLERGFGVREVGKDEPVTAHTLFAIGSTTKAITAFVLATLVDQGKLEWDKPVIEYLPDFRLADVHATWRLKVRDLLVHSSGLPRHDLVWYNSQATRAQLFERLRYLEPTRDLGEEFQYQNLMYLTAGYLAERITGERWEDLVRGRIFAPLGMTRSNFSVRDSEWDADHAAPHALRDRTATRIPFRNIDTVGPAGSVNSCVAEMANWLELMLSSGEVDGRRLIAAATLRELHTPQTAISAYPQDSDTLELGYALGWLAESHRGRFMLQHGGGIDGFISWVAFLPFDALGVVVYTNASGLNPLPTAVARTAIDRVLGFDGIDYLARAMERMATAAAQTAEAERNKTALRKTGTQPSRELSDYAGEYQHDGYGIVAVAVAGTGLRLQVNDIQVALEHWHYDTWNGVVPEGADPTFEDAKIQFRLDPDGEIAELVAPFEPSAAPIVFTRRPDARLFDPGFLERLAGVYLIAGQQATVTLAGDQLVAALPGQPGYTLEPKRGTTFALRGLAGYRLEFLLDPSGVVTGARLIQPEGVFEAQRIAAQKR